MPDNNFDLTGDEARLLMMAMVNSAVTSTLSAAIQLYLRLADISRNQPPTQVHHAE